MLTIMFLLVLSLLASVVALAQRVAELEGTVEAVLDLLHGRAMWGKPLTGDGEIGGGDEG